jgi:hypothetical protein
MRCPERNNLLINISSAILNGRKSCIFAELKSMLSMVISDKIIV